VKPTRQEDWSGLQAILPGDCLITDPVALLTYESDGSLGRGKPQAVVLPRRREEVAAVVRWAGERGLPLVVRGAGTGLSGGALAVQGGVVLSLTRMQQLLELDEAGRSAIVQPGMINLTLDERVKSKGWYYPPDPASGRACTLGGNVGENAGGPHCFKYGVTTNYVTGLEVVLADGRVIQTGGRAYDYPAYDLTGLLVGAEGTLGIVTAITVRLIRNPPAVKTLMAIFASVEQAGQAVSAVIARGLVPATLEMMDRNIIGIVEAYAHAGLPTDAEALLIIEADGYPESLDPQMNEIIQVLREQNARELRLARTAAEREQIWYARKSAFGAIAQISPAYYIVDGTVPRSQLADALAEINQICAHYNLRVGYVFHAGDGNLHPLILFDPADAAMVERVYQAGHEVMALCVRRAGTITGEHGVGSEKRQYMPLMFTTDELRAMQEVKQVFDPTGRLNPGKIFPDPAQTPGAAAAAVPSPLSGVAASLTPRSIEEAARALPAWAAAGQTIRIRGGGSKSDALPPTAALLSTAGLSGVRAYAREDLYVTVGAGTPLADLQSRLAPDRVWVPLISPWPTATIGGIVATNFNAPLRMRYGGLRDLVLAMTVVLPDGRLIRCGRPVVKNVAGYDLSKLFIGAHGTLGLIGDVTFRLLPLPRARASLIVPVSDLSRGLTWGGRLLRVCLVASALLLCRRDDLPAALRSAIEQPYALTYTAEGVVEDVAAELTQVRAALPPAEASSLVTSDTLSGSDLWAEWLRQQSAAVSGRAAAVCRLGVAPKDLPGLLSGLAAHLADMPFLADLASGLLYLGRVQSLQPLRQAAGELGGYVVVLAGTTPDEGDRWGYAPQGLELMRALKARWDARGLLNPGAFLV